jgi:hypothetical protein
MKLLVALAIAATASSPPADDKADVLVTINQFVDNFNKGDVKAAAACAEQTSIIDEFAPHEWHGAGACLTWMKDYDTDAKKHGITDGVVTLGTPKHLDIDGIYAYVVIPSEYSYKKAGKPVREKDSAFTFALKKGPAGWKITGWSWAKN